MTRGAWADEVAQWAARIADLGRRIGALENRRFTGPFGVRGYVEATATQSSLEAGVDLTGLSVTITFPANRRVRLAAYAPLQGSVAGDLARLDIKDGSTVVCGDQQRLETANTGFHAERFVTPTVGSHTYKLTATRTTGTGTLILAATSTNAAWLSVTDLGPI